ncbi:MAG: ComEC/Rec2 family competence protein [Clostridiales bacterium]|nr:ComEC/Rec2 family competence protein [Clostridiales bacterium]
MRKLANLRTPVIIALSLCGGIALGVTLYFYNLSSAWIALAALPAAIILCLWAIIKRKILKTSLTVLITLFLFAGGALNSFYALTRYDNTEIETDTFYSVCAEVIEMGLAGDGEYIIINKITVDGKKIDGKAYVYLSKTYGEICNIGYSVKFKGTLEKVEPFQYGELNSYAEENIKYRSSVFSGLQSTYKFNLLGSIKSAIGKTLFDNLNSESAAVAFAMLTGDTHQAESDSIENFRYGGIAHIFAVSGLHIGIVFAIVSFILKRLRINKYASAVISLSVILFYTAVCGFSLSALRATMMCAVSLLAKLIGERYDGLNALAIASIIILSFSPLSLFSVGFQLSVCAVGGIFCFSKFIEKALKKIKTPRRISSAAGLSAGAQLGTMPILLSNFGYISGAGLLLNFIILPLLSVFFVIIFLATMLCTVIPIIAPFVIPYAAVPIEFIISVFVGAGFEKSLISGFGAAAFVPLYFICILSLSDKINFKLIERIIAIVCSVIILTSYVMMRTYSPFMDYCVVVSAYSNGGEVLIKSSQGNILIVTEDVNSSRLTGMLNRNYCKSIDTLIMLGECDYYSELGVDCKNIFACDRSIQIQPYGDIKINYVTDFTDCGINCTFYDEDTLVAEVGGVKFGICSSENTQFFSCDILVSDYPNNYVHCGIEVYFNYRHSTLNVFDCGDISFKIKDGKYRLINVIPPKR